MSKPFPAKFDYNSTVVTREPHDPELVRLISTELPKLQEHVILYGRAYLRWRAGRPLCNWETWRLIYVSEQVDIVLKKVDPSYQERQYLRPPAIATDSEANKYHRKYLDEAIKLGLFTGKPPVVAVINSDLLEF